MRVLFCTDGSELSFNALKNFAIWQKDATVDVFCSIDYSFLPDTFALEIAEFEVSCANIASAIFNITEEEITNLGLNFGKNIQYCGETVSGILDTARENQYDLILLGSNGKKGVQKWLGSVSSDVINHSKNSVYISKHANEGQKVLFATDGTLTSKPALDDAVKFLNLEGKEIYVCIVLENPNLLFLEGSIDTNWLMKINEIQQRYAEDILSEFKNTLSANNLKAKEYSVLSGIPAEKIAEYAKEKGADLIILGSRSKKGFLQTSVSKRVAELAKSDTVIFRK